ncbi:FMRFamide-activated amiloride-sensitive sodium channel-like [Ruditapes philippinarum]|uniref:FMRFamide-activated amiloride-sensitive sodium channel-like n=1 Tax=Ruditapes philippinarum TaxID=129788 RepID=UPI00295AC34C|nr:FMRFamide-activated amiloride-sensitive sodium channel-like [Ruditapes philippinarum]
MDSTKEKRTLKEVLKELAESSALHGIPKIASSRQLSVKILWCIVVLAGTGVMTYQLVELFQTFYSNPIQTTVSLDFSTLQFPAISICNMNPVRKSKIGMSIALVEELFPKKEKRTDSLVAKKERRKRDTSENIDKNSTLIYSGMGLPDDTKIIDATLASWGVASVDILISRLGGDPYKVDDTYIEIRREYKNSYPMYSWSISYPPKKDNANEIPVTEETDYIDTTPEHENVSDSNITVDPFINDTTTLEPDLLDNAGKSATASWADLYEWDSDIGWDIFDSDEVDDYFESENFTSGKETLLSKPIAKFLKDPKDKWDLVITEFRTAFRDIPQKKRKIMGHQIKDFIQYVSFAKREQNIKEYVKQFTTSAYGNCYTLDDKKFQSWRSGPESGIKLTLNLEIDEYVERFSSGYGVRIVFHEPGTYPMPVEEGLTISAGFETSIGLRAINVTRLGEPYGHCTVQGGEMFRKKYNLTYSKTACLEFCRIENVIKTCNCLPIDAPDLNFGKYLDVCRHQDEVCTFEVELMFENGSLNCDCINPCSEFVYGKTISGRLWPHKDYLEKILMKDICSKKLTSLETPCRQINNDSEKFHYDRYRNNFVKVVIYFEDLNYQKITEEPFYTTVRFICDIGGAMGLFIGVSVLSMFEILQLIFEVIIYFQDRKKDDTETEELNNEKQNLEMNC